MRFFARIVVAVIATALLGLVSGVSTSATAQSTDRAAGTSHAKAVGHDTDGKRKNKVTSKVVKRGGGLYIQGKATGKKIKNIYILKSTRCNRKGCKGGFHKYRVTKGRGPLNRYSVKIAAPARGYWGWKAQIKGDTSQTWLTYRY